ncbi:MAG: phosphoenolpyruvate carboxylase [Myxococcota bacterium]
MPYVDEARPLVFLRPLMVAFEAVLDRLGQPEVAARLPWRERWSDQPAEEGPWPEEIAERCGLAHAIGMQLLRLAEERATQSRRAEDADAGKLGSDSGSWEQHLGRLVEAGVTPEAIARGLRDVRVEPVLTAHPTEARRRTVLHQYQLMYEILDAFDGEARPRIVAEAQARLDVEIERLWRTGQVMFRKPTLANERRHIVDYLARNLPAVLQGVEPRLRRAWGRMGFPAEALPGSLDLPTLTFGNWVGGDRDGHPGVTATVTRETLAMLRSEALRVLREHLGVLTEALSLSIHRQPAPEALTAWVETWSKALGPVGIAAVERNPDEPWRQMVNLLLARLPDATPAVPAEVRLADAGALLGALGLLRSTLVEVGATALAERDVDPVVQLVRTYGFRLAHLDLRQNSGVLERSFAALLSIGEPDEPDFLTRSFDERAEVLRNELKKPRPLTVPGAVPEGEAREILATLGVIADATGAERIAREAGLGAFIVSMTRHVSDLLTVFALARDAGVLRWSDEGGASPLPVVPLFETIDDLERAPAILDEFLSEPIVKRSQALQDTPPVQQVMIGYSDSAKDGGIVASFAGLYRAQRLLAEAGQRHGVRVRFFHGRGGTVGRGAGPTHRFLQALPPTTLGGDLRLTEQGEAIAQRYANRPTAAHHLELLLAGSLASQMMPPRTDPPELLALLDDLAKRSRITYRGLLDDDGFLHFFSHATPIDVIEQSRIGSRPVRRTGQRTLGDLRAIPWVFAWSQCRAALPAWFGFGSAVTALRADDPAAFERLVTAKATETRWSPVHYLVSNVATAVARASVPIFRTYAALVPDETIRDRLLTRIVEEHDRTHEALAAIYGAPIAQARRHMQASVDFREPALAPLHARQVSLLGQWRADPREELLSELLLSVNAISSGLGATG